MVKKLMGKLPLAAVVVGLALSSMGCETLKNLFVVGGKETEQSKVLLDGANDIVLAKDDGMIPSAFRVAFERKFSGVKFTTFPMDTGNVAYSAGMSVLFTYKERKYAMWYSVVSTEVSSRTKLFAHKFTSATGCRDTTKDEKKE